MQGFVPDILLENTINHDAEFPDMNRIMDGGP